MPSSRLVLTAVLLCACVLGVRAADPIPENQSLKQLMSPDEFRAAGLDKLNQAELKNLDAWLHDYRVHAEQAAAQAAVENVQPKPARDRGSDQPIIQSSIKGMFTGLTGRTRFLLENGQVWQQANTDDKFHAQLENPSVVLVKSIFGYRMVVVGYSRPFYVKQIILP